MMPRGMILIVLVGVLANSALEAREARARGERGDFIDVDEIARRQCTNRLEHTAGDVVYTVRFGDAIPRAQAQRFAEGLAVYTEELNRDYEILRRGLSHHLGPELFAEIADMPDISAPLPETEWYLVVYDDDYDGLSWRGSANYRVYTSSDAAAGRIQPPKSTLHLQVHSKTHFWVRKLLKSRRRTLPRWLEEGICEYVSMQFSRWKHGQWDGPRETRALLAWNRAAIRNRMFNWRHGKRSAWAVFENLRLLRERGWESGLRYQASLGLVLGIEQEIGTSGLIDVFKQLVHASPEKDREVIAILERATGKPLARIGAMQSEARTALLDDLLERADRACKTGIDENALDLHALGYFSEHPARVAPMLTKLALCEDADVAFEGIEGLIVLGRPELVERALDNLMPEMRDVLDLRDANQFERGRRRARRWFNKEWSKYRL